MIVKTSGSNSSAGEYAHAFLYDYDAATLLDLGTLHNGLGLTNSAADINESNQVVGKVPLNVPFSSAGSHDPDGSIASYTWNFGDGSANSNEANPTDDYTTRGTFAAVLTVTDARA